MSKKDLSASVLKRIKKENIKPKPKWEFLLKNYVLWGLFGLCVVIGGMVASMIIFKLVTHDWELHRHFGENFFKFHVRAMPFFWIILLVAFVMVADYNFKHTKKGYKYGLPLIIIGTILASAILGCALFGVGMAKKMDEAALRHFPLYKEMTLDKDIEIWSQTDKGIIGGKIINIKNNEIEIKGFKGKIWEINTEMVPENMLEQLEEGMVIGGFGEKNENGGFDAEKLKPWKENYINLKENKVFLRTT